MVEQAVEPPLGDGAHFGQGDGQVVGRERDRRPVEVAAGLDATVREDHRVVDGRCQLAVGRLPHEGEGVAGGAVDLGVQRIE